jgi:universal stress protein F
MTTFHRPSVPKPSRQHRLARHMHDVSVRKSNMPSNNPMFSVVLAAVDGSGRSAGVLRAAAEIARRSNGRAYLYRSVTIPQDFPAAARMPPDNLPALLVAEARRELQALASDYPDVTIEEPATNDPPQAWRGIIDAGERLNADLIVIGSHGYGGWDRVLGTTAANVVNRAERSVLVVHDRPPQREQRG